MQTASTLIGAAGALMAVLSAHADLPAPRVTTHRAVTGERDDTGALVRVWGLNLGLHSETGLGDFEQWRQALGIDPATVDHDVTGTTAWLIADATYAGTPLTLVGYYTPTGTTTKEEAS
ncbi:hypothetical protein ACFVFS_18430 [Kitasatospora sp. NPDC057692]|uniref:hypothetical protein n=1 Tax=Kitasatospora sp. NPDC057692 TaxID=3346215 RepID=UPI003678E311